MIRTCDGTDRFLHDGPTPNAGPCACRLTFDDVERSTVYPHVFLPTAADREKLTVWLDTVAVEDLAAMGRDEMARRAAHVLIS